MPYAIHLRKSRADIEAEARGEGESLSRHQQRLRALADRMQLDVVAEYREIISGDKLSDRPEMQRLLADVSAGKYDGVLTVEVSRLTRGDLMDQGFILNTFKYSGTKIITPEHTYDLGEDWDEDVITSDMMMARREYKYIKRRLQRGRLASANEGLWQAPAPFGYRKVKIQRGKGWTLEPDPEQAALVRMIYDMYVQGIGGQKIAQRLNALGSRTNKGNPWTASGVGVLTRNPVYMGFVRWNDRTSVTRMVNGSLQVKREKSAVPLIVKGKHDPIVSTEQWEAAQRSMRAHDRVRCHATATVRNPLAGLVYCAVCGKSMIRKDNGTARGSQYDMLRCTTPDCPTKATALSIVERSVISILEQWALQADSGAPSVQPRDSVRLEALQAAQVNLDRLRTQRARIFDAYEDGAYDTATFVQRRADKDAEIEAAERALCDLQNNAAPSEEEIIRMQLPQIRHVLGAYDMTLSPEDRNAMLKTVIARVEYQKTKRCYRNQDPSQYLTLSVHPLAPNAGT